MFSNYVNGILTTTMHFDSLSELRKYKKHESDYYRLCLGTPIRAFLKGPAVEHIGILDSYPIIHKEGVSEEISILPKGSVMRTATYKIPRHVLPKLKVIFKKDAMYKKNLEKARKLGCLHHNMAFDAKTCTLVVTQIHRDEESMMAYVNQILPKILRPTMDHLMLHRSENVSKMYD